MAKNEIAYRIVVDTSKAADEIRALEAEIARLKNELTGISEGTVAFDTVSQAVQGLETRLDGVIVEAQKTGDVIVNESQQASSALNNVSQTANKAGTSLENAGKKAQNISFEKGFQAFVKVGSAVTSSFAAAQAAIGLFGGDSTKVAEAAAKAQNALTIAIAAREIAEGLGAITTVKATIAQQAKNAADTASIGILQRLFLIISKNPYIALAVAIGAVTLAFYNLVNAETAEEKQAKSTTEALKELNDQLLKNQQGVGITVNRINNLSEEFKNGRIELNQYIAGLKNFISNIEEVYKYLDAGDITSFINNQIKIVKIQQDIAAAQTLLTSDKIKGDVAARKVTLNEIERLDIELAKRQSTNNEFLKIIENRKKAESDLAEQNRNIAEENRQIGLEEIRQKSELEKQTIKLLSAQQKLGDLDVEFETTAQLEQLKQLSESTEDYLTVIQKYQKITADNAEIDSKRIQDAENQITNFNEKILNLDKLLVKGFDKAKVELRKEELRGLLKKQFEIESGVLTPLEEQLNNASSLVNFQIKFVDEYTNKRLAASKNTGEALRQEQEAYRSEAETLFETLVQNEKGLISYQGKVTLLKEELANASKETNNLKNSTEVLSGFIKENFEDIVKQFKFDIPDGEEVTVKAEKIQTEINQKTFDKEKKFGNDILSLETQFLKQGLDIRNASYETKLQLLATYVQAEVVEVTNGEKKKQEQQKTTLDKFKENIAAFQSLLNTIQQTSTLFYDAQLSQLEKRNKRIQDNIIGESEAANKKRIEADKAYLKEKERIEKNAAKTSLRISLAQSLANTAEAVTKVTADLGPLGLVAAGGVVAFNLAQTAIIANQLANIDSYRSGGRIKKKMGTGGFLEGPSHEQGGIKFQRGGIELEGNESVINRVSTINYMSLLSQINQAGGGRPIGPGFDDSRIVEAIAKQRNTPIRAYVVESDITSKQETARRLDKLSQI